MRQTIHPSDAKQFIVAQVVKTLFWPDIRRSRTGFGHERLDTGTTMIDADVREIMPDMSCPPPPGTAERDRFRPFIGHGVAVVRSCGPPEAPGVTGGGAKETDTGVW